ncbi:hypothetical protein ACFVMC_21155 [Nocardia sp. NPDC127579]|uniref:hypothetical protein n=1 Tax=Nocardia sp. NPDC127579 TaxID=3345402 RepID=UPI003633CF96
MHAFVPNDYRKRVLADVERRGGIDFSDPFELYDIPLGEAETLSDAEVSARIQDVWGFWQKQRDHPKYRVLVGLLVDNHERLSELLLHSGSRRAEAARVRSEREQRDAERFEMLDIAISRLVQRYGGVPAGKVAGLEEIGAMGGLTAAEVATRLHRHRVIQEQAPVSVLTEQRRKQIRQLLNEWERLLEGPPTPTLFALLQIDPAQATHTGEIRLRAEALRARSRELPPGRVRVVLDELLVHVHDLLEAGGAATEEYVRSITEDVAAELRPKIRAAVLVEDQLIGDDYEYLLEEAIELGLDRGEAIRLLAEIAGSLGARIENAPYSGGGEPYPHGSQPAGEGPHSGGGASYSSGAGAGSAGGRGPDHASGAHHSAAGGPHSGPRFDMSRRSRSGVPHHTSRDWERPLKAARAALRGGRPQEAARHVAEARQLDAGANGGATPIRPVADEVERVLSEAAAHWREAITACAARRYVAATEHLEFLRRNASDVPPPTGQDTSLDQLVAEAEQAIATADRLVSEAATSADPTRALLAAQSACADHAPAAAALAATPIDPPPSVTTTRLANGSVLVIWAPSPTGNPDYKVTRQQPDGSWRTVGRTRSTELEDGGAPPTGTPTYAVVAAIAGRYSTETRSDQPATPPISTARPPRSPDPTIPPPPTEPASDRTTPVATAEAIPADSASPSGPISMARPPRAGAGTTPVTPGGTDPSTPRSPSSGPERSVSDVAAELIPPGPAPQGRAETSPVQPVVPDTEQAAAAAPPEAISSGSASPDQPSSGSRPPVTEESGVPAPSAGADRPISMARTSVAGAQQVGSGLPQADSIPAPEPLPDAPEPDGIPTVGNLALRDGQLTFDWPAGVTEVMVVVRGDAPARTPMDPRATSWKVTNSRYQIDGGVPIGPASMPCHVAVASCRRAPNGVLVVASAFAATARLTLG